MVDITFTIDGDETVFDAHTAEGGGWMGRSMIRMPASEAKLAQRCFLD